MPLFVFPFPSINVANLSQSNAQQGANVAIGSLLVTQTLVQQAGNSAVIRQH